MNSACLIAACASNVRNINNKIETKKNLFEFNGELYYHLTVRKYYHFEQITLVAPIKNRPVSAAFSDNFIPESTVYIETVTAPARTFAQSHCFYINSKDCPNGINKYLETNLSRYTESSIWEFADAKVNKEYLDYIKRIYDIDLKPECRIMTTQFCVEVNPV